MSTDFHTRLREIIEAVLELPDEAREDHLLKACGADDALLREVRALLPHYIQIGDFDPGGPARSLLRLPGTTTFTRLAGEHGDELEWTPPFSIPPYAVVEILGRGGMGVVYRAVHPTHHTHVAIKVLRHLLRSPEDLRRFRHEEEVLRQLNHPGIARLIHGGIARIIRPALDQSWAEERPYFVMELVSGQPLTRYADEHELSALQRLELLVRVCEAVEYAHHRGVIHQDLKPDNIMVDNGGQPKILDFGIAQVQTFEPTAGGNREKSFAGTLAYASPEQRSPKVVPPTPASDVYTLGLIAHELLTGALPHRARGRMTLDLRPVRLSEQAPVTASDEFRHCVLMIVATALRKIKGQRYATAGELGADLEQVIRAYGTKTRRRGMTGRLAELLHGRPEVTGGRPNRLLAAVLRKRIEFAIDRDEPPT